MNDAAWAHELPRTRGELLSRVYANPVLHRLVPTPVAVSLALLRGELEWRVLPSRRRLALRAAGLAAPVDADECEVRELARAHLRETCVQTELSWRPWDARRMPIDGLARIGESAGRGGVILALLHMGPMYSLFHALAARGVPICIPTAQQRGMSRFTGADAHWVREQFIALERMGHRLVPRGGAYDVLAEALREGRSCGLAWDVPGPVAVELLGRRAWVRSGIVRLAIETGVPILPAYTVRDGLGQRAVIEEPVARDSLDDAQALTAALASRMDAIVTAYRAQVHVRSRLRIFEPPPGPEPLAGSRP